MKETPKSLMELLLEGKFFSEAYRAEFEEFSTQTVDNPNEAEIVEPKQPPTINTPAE